MKRKKVQVSSYHVVPIMCSNLLKSKYTTNVIYSISKEEANKFTKDIKSVECIGGAA